MNINDTKSAAAESVTLRGRGVTRDDVLEVIARCDELGKADFLAAHGYKDSVRYHLRHDGRSYPSKAILGAAAGLKAKDHFGGARETVSLLGRLGFHVRNSDTGEMVDALGLDKIRADMVAAGFDDPAPAWPTLPITPAAYFLSGSNRPGEIAALGKVGADIGVAAPEISPASESELHALGGSDVLVFVDSGAFSEVAFGPAGAETTKPISDQEWADRLALYKRLAVSLGSSLFCVAPDQVGSQSVTLERLERYRAEIRELHDLGARVLVAIQKGDLSQADFAEKVDEVLGFDGWVPALPCKKAATTAGEVEAFVEARQPAHVHLLGLGIRNRNAADYVSAFAGTATSVSLDSCWVTANVGRNKNKDGSIRTRRYTLARDLADQVLSAAGRLTNRLKVEAAIYACLAGPIIETISN